MIHLNAEHRPNGLVAVFLKRDRENPLFTFSSNPSSAASGPLLCTCASLKPNIIQKTQNTPLPAWLLGHDDGKLGQLDLDGEWAAQAPPSKPFGMAGLTDKTIYICVISDRINQVWACEASVSRATGDVSMELLGRTNLRRLVPDAGALRVTAIAMEEGKGDTIVLFNLIGPSGRERTASLSMTSLLETIAPHDEIGRGGGSGGDGAPEHAGDKLLGDETPMIALDEASIRSEVQEPAVTAPLSQSAEAGVSRAAAAAPGGRAETAGRAGREMTSKGVSHSGLASALLSLRPIAGRSAGAGKGVGLGSADEGRSNLKGPREIWHAWDGAAGDGGARSEGGRGLRGTGAGAAPSVGMVAAVPSGVGEFVATEALDPMSMLRRATSAGGRGTRAGGGAERPQRHSDRVHGEQRSGLSSRAKRGRGIGGPRSRRGGGSSLALRGPVRSSGYGSTKPRKMFGADRKARPVPKGKRPKGRAGGAAELAAAVVAGGAVESHASAGVDAWGSGVSDSLDVSLGDRPPIASSFTYTTGGSDRAHPGLPVHVMPQTMLVAEAVTLARGRGRGAVGSTSGATTKSGLVSASSSSSRAKPSYGGAPSGVGGLSLAVWGGQESFHVAVCASEGGIASVGMRFDATSRVESAADAAAAEVCSIVPRVCHYARPKAAQTDGISSGLELASAAAAGSTESAMYTGAAFTHGKFSVGARRLKQVTGGGWSASRASSLSSAGDVPLLLCWGPQAGVQVMAAGRANPLAQVVSKTPPKEGRRAVSIPTISLPVPSAEALAPWERSHRRVAAQRADNWTFGPAALLWEDRVALITRGPCVHACKVNARLASKESAAGAMPGSGSSGGAGSIGGSSTEGATDGTVSLECVGTSVPASSGTSLQYYEGLKGVRGAPPPPSMAPSITALDAVNVPRCTKFVCGTSDGILHVVDAGSPRGAPGSASGCGVTVRTFASAPSSSVECVASPRASGYADVANGAFCIFGSSHAGGDATVRLWDARSGSDSAVGECKGHAPLGALAPAGSRSLLAFSPCMRYVAVAAADGAWVYDLRRQEAVARLDPRQGIPEDGPRAAVDPVVAVEWVSTRPGLCMLTAKGVLSMWK